MLDRGWAAENGGRNLVLGMSADACVLFKARYNYSTKSYQLILLNLNPVSRSHANHIIIHALVTPGPRVPTNCDIFTVRVATHLKEMRDVGIRTLDSRTGEYFYLKAMLLFTVNDGPGKASLHGYLGPTGLCPCSKCFVSVKEKNTLAKATIISNEADEEGSES